jgi:phenylacetate-coenzyme A ligase PaaK-like adenylate-forming protein
MRPAYERRRLADFAAGLKLSRRLSADAVLPRAELEGLQQRRLDALVRHAIEHSPFHRERLAGLAGNGRVELAALPVMTKAEMMERYDEVVCDPRLKRDALLEWIAAAQRDDHYAGEFRVMTTSGSSGRKGLFVYDRESWRWVIAMFLRQSDLMGVRPRWPRFRIAAVHGAAQAHMSRQVTASVAVGVHRVTTLPVTLPVEEQVAELGRFRPDWLTGYPSVLARLAEEQLAGRLDLELSGASTSSELCTPEVAARIREAFGVTPFDIYATTEGLWGGHCSEHDGHHLYEDLVLVENVDAAGAPVPAGTPGARVLLTSLINRVQPIIRLEVTDVMVLDDAPCACGRTLVRARRIEGRADDVLELQGVAVQPLEFGLVSRDPDVVEFQVVQDGGGIVVRLVARAGASGVEQRLQERLAARLAELGVAAPRVGVERVADLPRTAGGKLQLVVAQRSPGAASAVGV